MHLEVDEFDHIMSVKNRYVNMSKRYIPQVDDFDKLTEFIHELHSIHSVEKKIILKRLPEVTAAQELAEAAHYHPGKFYKKQTKIAEFKRFFHKLNNKIFNTQVNEDLAAIYAQEARIARIDVGYHAYRTGKENGREVLALFNNNLHITRITFTDGNTLDIPDLDQLPQMREIYEKKMRILPTLRQAGIAL